MLTVSHRADSGRYPCGFQTAPLPEVSTPGIQIPTVAGWTGCRFLVQAPTVMLGAFLLGVQMSDLIGVAAIVFGFGVTVVMFRIQRELQMQKENEPTWIAYSDYLILASIFTSLFLVLLPVLLVPKFEYIITIARAGCVAAIILEAGYIPSILAHYRIGFGKDRHGARTNPEPTERRFVWLFAIFAAGCFSFVLLSDSLHLIQY